MFEDDFPFPKEGYVSFLEGMSDGNFIYARWKYELDFSQQMEHGNDSWG